MEVKFIPLDLTGEEADWLKNLFADISLWNKPVSAISIHCNNQAAIAKDKSKTYNGKFRHICLSHNRIKQLQKYGVIIIDFIRWEKNLVDPLTKGLLRI